MADLPTVDPGYNISAVTGIANRVGDYRGPVKNHAPNPDNYWWGAVCTEHGWKHVQEVGREKTVKGMLKLGARPMEATVRRIRKLLLLLFGQINQQEASRHLKIATPLISRTLTEARAPSRTLVEALCEYPGVNAEWLINGHGEPLNEGFATEVTSYMEE